MLLEILFTCLIGQNVRKKPFNHLECSVKKYCLHFYVVFVKIIGCIVLHTFSARVMHHGHTIEFVVRCFSTYHPKTCNQFHFVHKCEIISASKTRETTQLNTHDCYHFASIIEEKLIKILTSMFPFISYTMGLNSLPKLSEMNRKKKINELLKYEDDESFKLICSKNTDVQQSIYHNFFKKKNTKSRKKRKQSQNTLSLNSIEKRMRLHTVNKYTGQINRVQ